MALLMGHPSRDVFVFVHGFNTPFGFGVRTAAAQGRALRKGLTVCLAWPSDPPGEGAGWLIKRVSAPACFAPSLTLQECRIMGWGVGFEMRWGMVRCRCCLVRYIWCCALARLFGKAAWRAPK